ncbi:heterocycloanthracin/sonorensin family bacteriocin [Bacillus sp. AGMB 02131]|uniref:Heterocycloanthracin/sonorensin family bacteriocin n=1 Tax=Peribacillus faecalis TaxID=2772559 RepID=A0A927CYM6_9BACI|nr:heterocycloanthracin/sonorensin family bacteriocin [Peribacillus faecalis]MBD3108340.1 heterocycloanthracin/sonorensin family bacteriocin [Peribacillus faecalis]
MYDFQNQLQSLNVGDFQTGEVVPWDQNQYTMNDSRLFIGGCIGGFLCFGCFSCFGCVGRCGGCGGRCGGCGRCGRCR